MKNQKKNICAHRALLLNRAHLLIATAIITVTLSPVYTKTAYDPNQEELSHLSDVAKKTATEKLYRAVEVGNIERALEAIHEQADINAQNAEGRTALTRASFKGNDAMVRLLLEHNARIDLQDKTGNTALMHAAYNNNIHIVRLLLEHKASVNIQDRFNSTALMHAACNGYPDIVRLLLEHNAHLNAQNNKGKTALIETISRPHATFESYGYSRPYETIIDILILYGADTTIADYSQKTALSIASASPRLRDIVDNAIQKRAALENELGQQNWDLETSSPTHIIEQFIIPDIVPRVCSYADPYDNTIEQSLLRIIKHYIRNKR